DLWLTTLCVLALVSFLKCGVICEQRLSSASILNNEVVGLPTSGGVSGSGSNDNSKQHTTSFVASGPTPNDEYRASYFYPASHHPQHHGVNWNRDTYADAANDFGYNQQQPHHQAAATNPGAVYAPAYGSTGESEGYEDSLGLGSSLGGGLGGLGGLGGVAGILGIKGLKGLGILGLFKAAIPILAILLPALLLIPLIFLFFPVPVITVPATGQRGLMGAFNLGEISGKMTNLARSVLESDKCMERISCEMSRVSRGSFIDRTLKRVLPRFEPHMPQVLKRFARVFLEQPGGTSCNKKYNCYLMDDSSSSTAKKSTTS
ncbi:RNA polymerase II elongation factor ELL, partial [Orchesella cincta]